MIKKVYYNEFTLCFDLRSTPIGPICVVLIHKIRHVLGQGYT